MLTILHTVGPMNFLLILGKLLLCAMKTLGSEAKHYRIPLLCLAVGSYAGGAVVAIQGSGFDPNITKVLICNRECIVHLQNSTSTQLNCEVPPNNGMYQFKSIAYVSRNVQ